MQGGIVVGLEKAVCSGMHYYTLYQFRQYVSTVHYELQVHICLKDQLQEC